MARLGEPDGGHILRAVVDDEDLPSMFAIQARAELERLGLDARDDDGRADIDLDATIRELLRERHPAPVLG